MTDSRAALEEAARTEISRWRNDDLDRRMVSEVMADFYEQESSSLKLLLSAMIKGNADVNRGDVPKRFVHVYFPNGGWRRFPVELDSSGIPVLTPEILEALKNAAIF